MIKLDPVSVYAHDLAVQFWIEHNRYPNKAEMEEIYILSEGARYQLFVEAIFIR